MIRTHTFAALALAAAALALSAPARAQPSANISATTAATYNLDPRHTALEARVPHFGFSFEVFRFGDVSGQIVWNPASLSASQLSVTAHTASIVTPVDGGAFGTEIAGDRFLKSAQFPDATFVSTAFHQTDASHGRVDGNLTLMGVTKPVTFDVELIGAGQNQQGKQIMGVHASTQISGADFGLPPFIPAPIQIVVDAEFRTP